MNKDFSKSWKGSKKPSKQRKYLRNAPLHIKQKIMKCSLSKELKEEYKLRNLRVRKGDTVKLMSGMFKGKIEKVKKVLRTNYKLLIENITIEKKDGTKVDYPVHYSNVLLTKLDLTDTKRIKSKVKDVKKEKKEKVK